MTRSQLGAAVGSVLMACYISLIVAACQVEPVSKPKFPPPSDPATLPYDARYPGLTVDY